MVQQGLIVSDLDPARALFFTGAGELGDEQATGFRDQIAGVMMQGGRGIGARRRFTII